MTTLLFVSDVPKSAVRKYQRGMPTVVYMWRVSGTTFRGQMIMPLLFPLELKPPLLRSSSIILGLLHRAGHLLGVAASWIVQVGIDTYRFLSSIFGSGTELDEVEPSKQAKILGKKVFGTTVRCGASLVFASVGAGLGATVLRPSLGQWIGNKSNVLAQLAYSCAQRSLFCNLQDVLIPFAGCAAGDLAGPTIVTICFEKFLHMDL